jgi:hypothetical protein
VLLEEQPGSPLSFAAEMPGAEGFGVLTWWAMSLGNMPAPPVSTAETSRLTRPERFAAQYVPLTSSVSLPRAGPQCDRCMADASVLPLARPEATNAG